MSTFQALLERVTSKRTIMLAFASIIVLNLAFPPSALAAVAVDGQQLVQGSNAVGGGTATLSDASLDMANVTAERMTTDESLTVNFNGGNDIEQFRIEGSANVEMNFAGTNEVEDTHVHDNATAIVNANGHNSFEEVEAYDNASLTVNVTGENDFEDITASDNASVTVKGVDCQKRDIANIGEGEEESGISAEKGNVTIDHVTVNLVSETALIGSTKNNLSINTSKIASSKDCKYAEIVAGGTMNIFESVIGIVGTVHSDELMTIEHSDVDVSQPDSSYDDSPYRVFSETGIELLREKNGEVKTGDFNDDVYYVDTGDDRGFDVHLKADGTPEYYRCMDKKTRSVSLPKTGDTADPWLFAIAAGACVVVAGFAARRYSEAK